MSRETLRQAQSDNFFWETLLQSVETDIHQNDNLPFLVILEK